MGKLKEPGVCRIFFSSPFNGMEGEREELTKRYWPQMQALCNSKGLQFVPVDMRWGITTELSNNNQTINICLGEIDRSDIFVGFFGQRYGWHGEKDEALQRSFDASISYYPWIDEHRGKSITELEFMHGHLNQPGKMPAFICFRDKKWDDVHRKEGEQEGDKKKIYKYSTESDHATDLMNDLKTCVKAAEAKTLGIHMAYNTPKEGAALMSKAVLKYLEEVLLKDTEARKKYAREVELAEHDAFCDTRTSLYVKEEEYIRVLNTHISDGSTDILLVLGEPGSGKTALLCSWLRNLQKANIYDILVYHFIGSSSSSTDLEFSIRRVVKELSYQLNKDKYRNLEQLETFLESTLDKLEQKDLSVQFKKVLTQINEASRKAIIIIDGLEKLTVKQSTRLMYWLPDVIPNGIHIILSTQASDQATIDAIKENWSVTELTTNPLTPEQQRQMCQQTLKLRGKELSEGQLKTVLEAENTLKPLFLKIALEELCLFGRFRELDNKIQSLVNSQSSQELFDKYLERMEQDYNSSEYSSNLVKEVLCALYTSRRGLSETELIQMLDIQQYLWSPLFYGLQNYIIIKSNLIGIAYEELKKAVFERYISTEENMQKYYRIQKDFYLDNLQHNTGIDDTKEKFYILVETFYTAYKCKDIKTVLRLMTTPNYIKAIVVTSARSELLEYVQWLNQPQESLVQLFFEQLNIEMARKYAEEQMEDLIAHPNLVQWLSKSLETLHKFFNFAQYQIADEMVLLRMKDIQEKNPDIYKYLEEIEYQLGCTYLDQKEPMKALPHFKTCIDIIERNKIITPIGAAKQVNIGHPYHSMGIIHLELGEYDKAEEYFKKSIEIHQQTSIEDFPDRDRDINTSHCNIAMCKLYQEKYEEALELYKQVLQTEEEQSFGQLSIGMSHILTNMGIVYRKLKSMEEAEKCYQKALKIKLNSYGEMHLDIAIGYVNLSNLARDRGDWPSTEDYQLKGLKILKLLEMENSVNYWIFSENLVNALIYQGKYDDAYQYYPKIYDYVVSNDAFDRSLQNIHFTMAQVLAFHKEKPEEGYKILGHLIRSKHAIPDHFYFMDRIARQCLYKGQSPPPVPYEESLEKCIQLFPTYLPAWEMIISEDLIPTRNVEAVKDKVEEYYSAVGGYEDDKLVVLTCQYCNNVGWTTGSVGVYEHFQPKFPQSQSILRNLAVAYAENEQLGEALNIYEQLIISNPDSWIFYNSAFFMKYKLEDFTGARELVNNLEEKFGELSEVQQNVTVYKEQLDKIDKYLESQAAGENKEDKKQPDETTAES